MDEAAGKVEGKSIYTRAVRLLALAGGAACILSATLYLLVLTQPIYYFRGLIEGHVSLIGYKLRYSYNGIYLRLYHSDYVSPVSMAALCASIALLTLSAASTILLLISREWLLPISLLYGVSSAFIASTGIIRFLLQVLEADVGSILTYKGAQIVMETSAGIIRYTGVIVERSLIHIMLSGKPPLLLISSAISTALTTTAMLTVILRCMGAPLDEWMALVKRSLCKLLRINGISLTFTLIIGFALLPAWASAFAYYPWTTTVQVVPPLATLTNPPYMYTCAAVTRTARGALTYTDFEVYPVPGWVSRGGVWGRVAGGYKGYALQGEDDNRGIGRASQYYWNSRVDSYSSLWASVRVRLVSMPETYRGLVLIRSDLNGLYEISIRNGWIYIRRWINGWVSLSSTTISGYSSGAWYTIVSRHITTETAVTFYVWVYDAAGSQVAYLTASDTSTTRFTPAYMGLEIEGGGTIYFDDFIVSTADPRAISFSGLQANMIVELWDNLGNFINSAVGSGSVSLSVVRDIVIGTGVNGRIVAKYPDGFLCINHKTPDADAVLGGDSYSLIVYPIFTIFGANHTSAACTLYISSLSAANTTARAIRVSATRTLYARLILEDYSAPATLHAALWIQGTVDSTKIIISGGIPVARTTSIIALNVESVNHIIVSGYFAETGVTATLKMYLEISSLNGLGACAYYPIVIELRSTEQ